MLAAYQALCRSLGVKLLALTPRPFGTLACVRESLKNDPEALLKRYEATGRCHYLPPISSSRFRLMRARIGHSPYSHAAIFSLTQAESIT